MLVSALVALQRGLLAVMLVAGVGAVGEVAGTLIVDETHETLPGPLVGVAVEAVVIVEPVEAVEAL